MGKIVPFNGITRLDVPADRILENAMGNLEGAVIMGYDKDGEMYFASSYADGGLVLWLMEHCKAKLLNIEIEE